jgi:hypothetical protein
MNLFIPPLGTKLVLLAPWQFGLHYEKRNRGLWDLKFAPPVMDQYPTPWKTTFHEVRLVTLDPGTELKVDRIFIRCHTEGYDSVTFRAEVYHMGVFKKVRFWAKLIDVNKMEVTVID